MPQVFGITRRDQPSKTNEGSYQPSRLGGRGEQVVLPMGRNLVSLCDEGAFFRGGNPTIGTGIIHALTTAWSATAAIACLRNTDAEGAKRLYPAFIRLYTGATAIGMTAATSIEWAITIDNTNRYASGGTVIPMSNNSMDSSQATIANLTFGAVVLTAASGSVRIAARGAFPRRAAPAMVTGDQFLWEFGMEGPPTVGVIGSATPATAPATFYAPVPPVVIGGGDSMNFHLWYPAGATTAPTYEFEIGCWER